MSSCSEYLVRQQLRTQKYIDTRPHMTCGQATEIKRQQAGSAVYEQFLPATACVATLNAPISRGGGTRATIARGHQVKDASAYVSYASAGATAQALKPANVKPSQIKDLCYGIDGYGVNTIREINDTILLSTLIPSTDPNYRKEDIIAKARQSINNCCTACGKVNFAPSCACAGLSPGLTNATTGGPVWKNTYIYPRTVT